MNNDYALAGVKKHRLSFSRRIFTAYNEKQLFFVKGDIYMKRKFTNFMVDNITTITIGVTTTATLVTGGIWGFLIGKYDF